MCSLEIPQKVMTMWEKLLSFWSKPTAPLGARGEAFVASYVKRELAMKVLARNVRCPGGEIDIVCMEGGDLIFLEVRTRSGDAAGPPELTVGSQKKAFLIRSARWYMARRRLTHLNPRFDLAAVIWPLGADPILRYHRNYFSAG